MEDDRENSSIANPILMNERESVKESRRGTSKAEKAMRDKRKSSNEGYEGLVKG
jgi:hypothetical protein